MPKHLRDTTFDILRGIGIAAVVLGHTGTPANPFVYLFHIPLFFFSSGYFFKDDALKAPLTFLWKRVKGLYFPYVACGLVALAVHNWLVDINIYSPLANVSVSHLSQQQLWQTAIDTVLFRHTELLLAPLWFLPVLFTVNIIFFIFRSISLRIAGNNQANLLLLVGITFATGITLLLRGTQSAWLFPVSLIATACYALGYWAAKYKDVIIPTWQGAVASLITLSISLPFSSQLDLRTGAIDSPGYFLLSAIAGIYLTFCVSRFLSHWRPASWLLSTIGKASLFILVLHILSFKAVAALEIASYDMQIQRLADFAIPVGSHAPWRLNYSVAGIVLPLLVYLGYTALTRRATKLS